MDRPTPERIEEIREENRLSGGDPMLTDLLAEIDPLRAERDAILERAYQLDLKHNGSESVTPKADVLAWIRAEIAKEGQGG